MNYKHNLTYKLISILLIALHLFVFSLRDAAIVFAEAEDASTETTQTQATSDSQTGSNDEPQADTSAQSAESEKTNQGSGTQAAITADPLPNNSPTSFNLSALNNLTPNLFTGAVTYSVPIAVPAGRKGIQPNIALTYSSQSGNGILGMGWDMDLGSIERSTKKGSPKYDSSDTFMFKSGGSTQELVSIGAGEYRPKIEGAFMKFYFDGSYWTVKDKSGITYRFGYNANSQVVSGAQVFKWCLDNVQDTLGNYMDLIYIRDNNQLYPDSVKYTGNTGLSPVFEVKFQYDTSRPDPLSNYRPEFLIKTNWRLKDIIVKQNNSQIRKYTLNYSQSPSTNRSLINSITQYSDDDNSFLPPITFQYQQAQPGWQLDTNWVMPSQARFARSYRFDDGVRLLDLNLDGLTDIIRGFEWHYCGGTWEQSYYTFLNNNSGWQSTSSWVLPTGSELMLYRESNWSDRGVRLSDVDGNGWLDIVIHRNADQGGGGHYIEDTKMNDGISGWPTNDPNWKTPDNPYCTAFSFLDSEGNCPPAVRPLGVQLIDIDSDGLVDVIKASGGGSHINNMPLSKGWTYNSSWNMPDGDLANGSTQFSEVNGDGLVDFVIASGSTKKTYIHNGSNWTYDSNWTIPDGDFVNDGTQMLDVNADGLDDILIAKASTRKTYINNGANWTRQTQWDMPDGDLDNGGTRFSDVNGDALIDLLIYYENDPPKIYLAKGPYPDILATVANGIGGTASTSYQSYKGANNTQTQDKSKLSFPVQVVTQITSLDGQGNSYSTSYSYDKGEFDFTEREFRGFGKVKVTDVDGNYSLSYFLQGDYDKGRSYKQESYDASGNPYTKVDNTWSQQSPYGGYPQIQFVYLSETNAYTFDGDSSGRRTKTQYFYGESPQYGNPTQVIEFGEVNASDGSDIGNDKRYTTTTYTYDAINWILALPNHSEAFDINNNKISEKWFYYDNKLNINDPPLQGLLTKEEVWLYNPITTNNQLLTTNYSYDSFGNLLTATDANTHTTSTTYDTTYYIYPLKVTNAIGHFVESEYYGINGVPLDDGQGYKGLFGQVKSSKDPNGVQSYNTYDDLGRLEKAIGPNDSMSYPAVLYEYDLNVTNPLTDPVKITKKVKSVNNPASQNYPDYYISYSFYDGLGRGIEAKTDAEPDPQTGTLRQILSGLTQYNSRGLVEKKYLPYFVNADANFVSPNYSQPYSEFQYDPLGRVKQTINPDKTSSTTSYSDWTVIATDEEQHFHTYYYDAYQRLIQVDEHNQGQIYTTTYQYDTLGNLTRVTDNQNNVTTIIYDSLGRKVQMSDPDMGVWNYEYDNVGNLTKQTDAKNQVIVFNYDDINRLLNKTVGQSSPVVYEYDNLSKPYSKGRLTKASYQQYQAGSTEFFYDNLGREIQSTKTVNGSQYTVHRTYDALDRLATLTYPDGEIVTYTYNPQGIETVNGTQSTVNVTYIANIDYSPTGQIIKQQYGNGTKTNYTYDPNTLRLNQLQTTNNQQQTIQNLAYQFDNVGNVAAITDAVNTGTQSFQYDDLNRLTYAQGASYNGINYVYDSIGNILQKGNITYTYNPNSKPHAVRSLSDGTTFFYDANGNITSKGRAKFKYDEENRLIESNGSADMDISVTINLNLGWNFVSFPVVFTDMSVSSVLAPVLPDIAQVTQYDASTQTFQHWINDPLYNQFNSFVYGKGYQIYCTNPSGVSLTLSGQIPSQIVVSLKAGANLIPDPNTQTLPVEIALTDLIFGSDYSDVLKYNPLDTSTPPLYFDSYFQGQYQNLDPGYSYYLDCSYDTTWTIPQNYFTQYGYDGDGGRVFKQTASKTTTYIGSLFEKTDYTDGTPTTQKKHIYAGANRVASIENQASSISTHYYHGDHLGSSNVITDATGQQVSLYEYSPFGEVSKQSGSYTTDVKYTGKIQDDTGLYYYGARYYDPQIGRFITPDTIVQAPSDPQSLNRYAYCRNNPIKYVDPSGRLPWLVVFAIKVIVSAAIGSVVGGALAGIMGGNIGQGFLTGAISGAAFGFVGALGLKAGIATIIGHTLAGTVSGAINAAVTGGNIGLGAAIGGASAGFGEAAGQLKPIFSKGIAKFVEQGARRSFVGALVGGATSAALGGDFGRGAANGAITASIAYVANHLVTQGINSLLPPPTHPNENTDTDLDVDESKTGHKRWIHATNGENAPKIDNSPQLDKGSWLLDPNQIDPATGKPVFALNPEEYRNFAEIDITDPKNQGKGEWFVDVFAPEESVAYDKTNVQGANEYRIVGPHEKFPSRPNLNP